MSPEKSRIVFLDDEPQIIDSLRIALRRERKRWSMRFFTSGKCALEALAEEPAEVILTDMRMPEMNGAEFLQRAAAALPNSVRIVLSGEAEEALTFDAIPYAHQWVTKPTPSADLINVVERALATSAVIGDSRAREIVTSVASLPVLPKVYQELTGALADGEVDLEAVSEIVEGQPSLGARMLQMANSAFFGLPRPVDDLREAVSYLGLDTIKSLVFAAEVVCELGPRDSGFSMSGFLQEAVATSRIASRLMAPDERGQQTAFSGGLLHDVGRLVLLQAGEAGGEYARKASGADEQERLAIEMELFGATHAEVGAALLGVWGLPHGIVDAVAHHHRAIPEDGTLLDPTIAVSIARTIVTEEMRAAREDDSAGSGPSPNVRFGDLVDADLLAHVKAIAQLAMNPESGLAS